MFYGVGFSESLMFSISIASSSYLNQLSGLVTVEDACSLDCTLIPQQYHNSSEILVSCTHKVSDSIQGLILA